MGSPSCRMVGGGRETSFELTGGGRYAGGIDLSGSMARVPLSTTDVRIWPPFCIGDGVAMVTLKEFVCTGRRSQVSN